MKRSELFFGAILLPIDFLALLLAGAAAYYMRTSPTVQRIRPAVFQLDLPFVEYMQLVGIVALLVVGIFALQGLYAMQVTRRLLPEVSRIFSGISLGIMLVIMYMFLRAELFQSRFILLAAYGAALVCVTAGRTLVRMVQVGFLRRGIGVHRVVLAGNGRYAHQLAHLFRWQPQLGYKAVGTIPIVRWDILEEMHRQQGVDEIIQTDPGLPEEDTLVLLDFCDKYKIDYKYIPNLFETYAAHVQYRSLGGVPIMELLRTPLDGWGRVAKRIMDLIGVGVGAIIFLPLYASVIIALKLDSPGPILYRQIRVGRNRELFGMYKFRSMYAEYCVGDEYGGAKAQQLEQTLREKTNERVGPLFKMKQDPRITRVGRWLRQWRIDELPQFINVLTGQMSLLGPRPHLPQEVQKYDKHQQKLFTIKPGMSGMAQVNGNAGLTFEQEANLDIGYIENWSLRLDIILLLKTFRLLLSDKNAV
jgi:exopolysaccharide biosynthesis polyprenyl glycosylphosphotransferase